MSEENPVPEEPRGRRRASSSKDSGKDAPWVFSPPKGIEVVITPGRPFTDSRPAISVVNLSSDHLASMRLLIEVVGALPHRRGGRVPVERHIVDIGPIRAGSSAEGYLVLEPDARTTTFPSHPVPAGLPRRMLESVNLGRGSKPRIADEQVHQVRKLGLWAVAVDGRQFGDGNVNPLRTPFPSGIEPPGIG